MLAEPPVEVAPEPPEPADSPKRDPYRVPAKSIAEAPDGDWRRVGDVLGELERDGVPASERVAAPVTLSEDSGERKTAAQSRRDMGIGCVVCLLGLVVTVPSYRAAASAGGGGGYVVFTGAMRARWVSRAT